MVSVCLVAAACSPDAPGDTAGLVFDREVVDLGTFDAGETVEVRFPFRVMGRAVRIEHVRPSCGCLDPRLEVDGATRPATGELAPGTRGEMVVDYRTLGFRGRKVTGVTLRGTGPGLPVQLRIDSVLRERYRIEPDPPDFGVVRGDQAVALDVEVSADEPFRVTEVLAGAAPLRVEGVPSPGRARSQTLRIVLPPSREEGRHAAYFNLGTDAGLSFRVPVRWEVAGEIYTRPGSKLLLGRVRADEATFTAITVGAREGELEPPEVELVGLPGAEARVDTLVAGSEYRVSLKLPEGLPSGALAGEVVLRLTRRVNGRVEPAERRVKVFGVVS